MSGPFQNQTGMTPSRQFIPLFRLTFGACLPPIDAYRFGILKDPKIVWDYVSDPHVAAFHSWKNKQYSPNRQSDIILSDKVKSTTLLASHGVPVAPIFEQIDNKAVFNLYDVLRREGSLFCKTRNGSRGVRAFECWIENEKIIGRKFEGEKLTCKEAVSKAWLDLLKHDEALVQPLLQNHPIFAHLETDGRAITVRCITINGIKGVKGVKVISAALEIPIVATECEQHGQYVILPISISNGNIALFHKNAILSDYEKNNIDQILKNLSESKCLPYWQDLIHHSINAHKLFPYNWAIAWDWILTPEGPILLEGNVSFGGATPQMIVGGFLSTPFSNVTH